MKSKIKSIAFEHHKAITYATSGLAFLLVFLAGAARYRFVIFFAFFLGAQALLMAMRKNLKPILLAAGPIMIALLFLDIKNGQIYPLFPTLNVVISIIILFVTMVLFEYSTRIIIRKITEDDLFFMCKKCGYKHAKLVKKCVNCGYIPSQSTEIIKSSFVEDHREINADYKERIEENIKIGIYKEPSKRIYEILRLNNDETVIVNFKLTPHRLFFKNGSQDIIKRLIVTNLALYFIDYSVFHSGWRRKEVVKHADIKKVSAEMKAHKVFVFDKEPVLTVYESDNVFEIYWKKIFPFKKRLLGVLDSIKEQNSEIEVVINIA